VAFTYPAELSQEIRRLVGHYTVDVDGPRTRVDDELAEQILAMSRTQFRVVRHLMQTQPWDYFQLVDIGLDRLHQGFWRNHDLAHDEHGAGSVYLETVRNYYRHLDDEIGKVLELLGDETVVLVVSPYRPQRPDAALRVSDRDDRSELGAFILAGPIRTLGGEVKGARLLDIAPTLLDLGGHEIPQSMQGRSLVELGAQESLGGGRPDPDDEQLVRERLSGLGYI
jgi:predicted AlkP superfamily phosphohydrolase/phosphomutase